MKSNLGRLAAVFLTVFTALVVAVVVWQIGWIVPKERCEGERKWWDSSERVCAQPVLISDITGRIIEDEAGAAAARAAIGRTDPAKP